MWMLRRGFGKGTAAVLVAVTLAACGGGGGDDDGVASLGEGDGGSDGTTSTTLSEEEAEEALLEWASCMRDHGVDMPDPQIGENGGVQIQIGSESGSGDEGDGGGPKPADRDAFLEANEACGEPPAIGGSFDEEDIEQMQEDALAFAECMRDEGIEDFPDPDFSDFGPGAGPQRRSSSGDGGDEGDDGEGPTAMISGPFGEIDLSDPAMQAAFEACQEEMGGPFGGRVATRADGAESGAQ